MKRINTIFQWPFLLSMPSGSAFESILIFIFFVLIVYALVKASLKSKKEVQSHWHFMFETIPFTPSEFYQSLEKDINEKGMDNLSFSTIKHSEGGLLSANRLYLRVKFREYMMDICAAPFAKEEFFVSWWFLKSSPVIRLLPRREKTFYEMDTEIMFKETVAKCVRDTIENLIAEKGMRHPDLGDWRGTNLRFKTT